MCFSSAHETDHAHKVALNCQLADLRPGQRYRTPEGDTMMVTDAPALYDGVVIVVNLRTGQALPASNSLKLGYDRADRLYAARRLNAPEPTPEFTDLSLPGIAGAI